MPFSINPKGDQFEVVDNTGKVYGTHPTRAQALAQQRALYANDPGASKDKATADVNDLPDSAFLHVESGGTKDDTGRIVPRSLRHLPYRTESGAIDLPKLRNALSRLGQSNTGEEGSDKWLTASLRDSLRAKAEKILANNTDAASAENKEVKPSLFQQVIAAITGKEGRRNSNTDAGRLQQIHDLSVENGAACPMVLKQADGKYRWVLLSSNSYQDREKEIVSQAALEADAAHMTETKQYGPLRLWHIGDPDPIAKVPGPGVDIGDCDYSEMFGRISVESGTFRNEGMAAAIKERADQWAGSRGFFHPVDQPDREGVYTEIQTFERSLLPRGKEANSLTSLAAIIKEYETMTNKEKAEQLAQLLGDPSLADTVLKQVEATEKAAQERGLKFKEDTQPIKPEEKPEEVTEPKPDKEPDYEAMAKGLEPHIMKMIETKMAEAKKETATKEAGLETAIKELTAQVKELTADQPRGFFNGFRPSQSGGTLLKNADGTPVTALKEGQPVDQFENALDQLIKGASMQFMPPTQATPPKA